MDLIFLEALAGKPTSKTPIWLMRQAGRYMASYRKLREKHSLLEMVKTPQLACEVTLQPIEAFGLDAAIIFADILPLLEAMGLNLEFLPGEGPHISNPIRTTDDIQRLSVTDVQDTLWFTLEAIRLTRRELEARRTPLIGFSGAPFTLACYAIEGGGSRDYTRAKQLMRSDIDAWHQLMSKLSEMIANYLLAQASAGAQVLQLFDSWAGILSPTDYATYVLPYTQAVIQKAQSSGVPVIYFSTGTSAYLKLISQLGANAYSVDWRVNLDQGWREIGPSTPIQGNLDPTLLLGPWKSIEKGATAIMQQAAQVHANRQGFIFNLGHGILQHTPEDNIKALVELLSSYPYSPSS